MKTVSLNNGKVIKYEYDVDVDLIKKILELPYSKLRKLVSMGGVKFHSTPSKVDLEMVLDEIDQKELRNLFIKIKQT